MAEPLVAVAIIGGFTSVTVAAIGLVGNLASTRRKPDPDAKPPGAGADMTAALSALGRQVVEAEAERDAALERAIACEARESLRKSISTPRRRRNS